MTYLDANATEVLRPEARAAVLAALDLGGNPASVHATGRAARRLLEEFAGDHRCPLRRPAGRPRFHLRRHRG